MSVFLFISMIVRMSDFDDFDFIILFRLSIGKLRLLMNEVVSLLLLDKALQDLGSMKPTRYVIQTIFL